MLLPNDRVLGGRPPPLCRARRGPRCFTVRSNALLEGSTFSLKALDLKRPIREADMARTLPEGDPRYATDFLPRTDGTGCSPGGGGRLRFMVALAASLPGTTYAGARWSTLAYVEKVRSQFLSLRHRTGQPAVELVRPAPKSPTN